jgi:hypothetical protein
MRKTLDTGSNDFGSLEERRPPHLMSSHDTSGLTLLTSRANGSAG